MEILSRAFIIYFLDMMFNKFIVFKLVLQNMNNTSEIFSLECNTFAHYVLTYLVLSLMLFNLAPQIPPMSLFHPFIILGSTFILGSMIIIPRIYLSYNIIRADISFQQYVELFHVIITCIYYGFQVAFLCMKMPWSPEFKSTVRLVFVAAAIPIAQLEVKNVNLPALPLIKFLGITILHFPTIFTEINQENLIEKCGKVSKLLVAFGLCQVSPELIRGAFRDENWMDIILDYKYFVVARVAFMFLVIKSLTDILHKITNFWLKTNFNYNFIQSFFIRNWASPVYFLLFQIDEKVWNKSDAEMNDSSIQIYVAIHSLVFLANVNKTIFRSLLMHRQAGDANGMGKRALRWTLFTFFGAICLLGASMWTFAFNAHLFIVVFVSVYVVTISVINALIYYFIHKKAKPENVLRHLTRLDYLKSIMRECLLALLLLSMLWNFRFIHCEITICMGALYYAIGSRRVTKSNWIKLIMLQQVKWILNFMSNISGDKLTILDDVCPICHEELTPDCVMTVCRHYYHKQCISAWLYRSGNYRCPMCGQRTLLPAAH